MTPPSGSNMTKETITPIVTNLLAPAGVIVVNVRHLLDSSSRMRLQKWVIEFRVSKAFDLSEVTRNKKVHFETGNAIIHYGKDFCNAHQICGDCLGSLVPANTRDRDVYCICRKFKKEIGSPEARETNKKSNKIGFEARMRRSVAAHKPAPQAAPPPQVATASAPGAALAAGISRMNTTN
jgi:hypothetical protein